MINKTQIEAIKYLIVHSKDTSELAKKMLLFLLEQPDALRTPINTTVVETGKGFSKQDVLDIYTGIHDMKSSNGNTHLNEIMKVSGSDFSFFVCAGAFQLGGEFKEYDKILSYTVWLSNNRYDMDAKRKPLTKEKLLAVQLFSSLYEEKAS